MISQTAEYALRAMVDLSFHQGQSRTNQQIADATQVPAGYLAKILKALTRHGLIRSQRGPTGGFSLEHDPTRITVFDILQAVDPPKRITKCPLGLREHRVRLCPLHQRLDDAFAAVERAFRDTTLDEVTARPERGRGPARGTLRISGGLQVDPQP
ncbi:MAG: Rrf2 family transcriptional regulator [Phycisphaeraceae bacterium]|nr:Rrf2 family transcriptional regulator [Phycisphaeraceae bacterium]